VPKVEQKQVIVNEIKEKLEKAVSIVLVDARGVTVEQDTELRKKFREAGVEYKVYKNSMMNFAIKGTQFEGLSEYLAGPSAIAISYTEATLAASIIAKEAKAIPNLEFKAGVVEGLVYDAKGIEAIASIPSKEVLLSRLLGSFQSPMATFARLISAIEEEKSKTA